MHLQIIRKSKAYNELTISRNRHTFKQLEPIGGLKGGDLAMGEFFQKLRLLVISHMNILRWELKGDASQSSGSPDLS